MESTRGAVDPNGSLLDGQYLRLVKIAWRNSHHMGTIPKYLILQTAEYAICVVNFRGG